MTASPLANIQLHLVDSIDSLMEMKRWAGERRETPMGVDTESGGLSAWHTRLRTIQVGDKHHGWCVPWDRWGGGAMEILSSYEGEFTWHNLPHDARFMKVHAGYDMPWNRVHDTMIMARIDDPMRPAGLKPLVSKLIDRTALNGQKALDDGMKQQGWDWDTVPLDFAPYWIYAAMDPVLNAHLWEKLHPRVMADCPDVYDLEMATQRVTTTMMINGMLIDPPYIKAERDKLAQFSLDARAWLKKTHGITSPMSGGQIARELQNLGQEIRFFTDSGAPKMDKVSLEAYQAGTSLQVVRDLIRYLLAIRHADKLVGTYLDSFVSLADADGFLHCSINSLAARTGRMSVSEPSLQNLPRDDKVVRGSFKPRTGNVFISCDLDQVEARMAAHFSEDPGLIQAFLDADQYGTDFFCGIAGGIFGEEILKGDHRRQMTKNTVYGSLYGSGIGTMARTAGVTYDQMAPVKMAFDDRFPGLKRLADEITEEAMSSSPPSIRTPMNRRLVMDKGREYTQSLNALIQGHAAEYMKKCLLNLDAAGLLEEMRLPIHDECILEVPAEEAQERLRLIEECMTDRINYRVPITAGGKIMETRWAK